MWLCYYSVTVILDVTSVVNTAFWTRRRSIYKVVLKIIKRREIIGLTPLLEEVCKVVNVNLTFLWTCDEKKRLRKPEGWKTKEGGT